MVFNLEKEALVASGLKEKDQIRDYLGKLDSISEQLKLKGIRDSSPIVRAENLFEILWKAKPNRYRQRGFYRLNEVLDAQLSKEDRPVGNCLGLTLLYHCLLKRIGIEAEVLHLENAFGIGPHVLTVLQIDDQTIDIENILPGGFDYNGHKEDPSRLRWGEKELVADVYQSRGSELFKNGELEDALKSYDMALNLNPNYEKAALNREILLNQVNSPKV